MNRVRALGGPNFLWIVLMTATISASSSAFCVQIGVAPWLMFLGWSTYVTGNGSVRAGWVAGSCALLGVPLSAAGTLFLAAVSGLGPFALVLTVFILTSLAVLSTLTPPLNSGVGWFLGLLGFVGSGLKPGLANIITVATPILIGLLSGWIAGLLAARIAALGAKTAKEEAEAEAIGVPPFDTPTP